MDTTNRTGPSVTASILMDVEREVTRAMGLHPSQHSAHESYAVILEEVDEFWEEVRKRNCQRDKQAMRTELIQIAAMAVRAIHDLGLLHSHHAQ